MVNDLSQASHIILGEDAFQTVTIVPTETNPGEVSYVLIVQQPDEAEPVEKEEKDTEEAEDQDLTVYDFEDADDPAAIETPVSLWFTFFIHTTSVYHHSRIFYS